MRFVYNYIRAVALIIFLLTAFMANAQPPITPPGQGGTPPGLGGRPPGPPCGVPGGDPCPPIPLSDGFGFLLVAGALIGVKKIYSDSKKKKELSY